MCLAIPGRLIEIIDAENRIAKVDVNGVRRNIDISVLDDASVGDYVLIHVGFALTRIDEQQAHETLRLLEELSDFQAEMEQFQADE